VTTQGEASHRNRIGWPLIGFFTLAYALAWGTLGIVSLIAQRSGIDSAVTLMKIGR
jgi:hypothetical protein